MIRSEYTYLQQYLVTSRTGFIVVQSYSLNIPSPKRLRLDSLQQNYLYNKCRTLCKSSNDSDWLFNKHIGYLWIPIL